jgi:hypothetical protein
MSGLTGTQNQFGLGNEGSWEGNLEQLIMLNWLSIILKQIMYHIDR